MQGISQLNVLVVDDHGLVRAGMRRLLEENPCVKTIAEASSGEEALQVAESQHFDIVLMDINLPGMNGLDASDKLLMLSPESRIIMVTGHLEAGHIRKLLNAGVRGYITKGSGAEEMDNAMRQVMQGEQYLSADVAQQMAMDMINGSEENPFDKLTSRESEIINLLLRGHRNRQISTNLHISEKTVSTHRTRAFEKLGLKTTAELVRLAMRHGLWN
ncbi:MAG: response regulator [Granulosicoccus sp.]